MNQAQDRQDLRQVFTGNFLSFEARLNGNKASQIHTVRKDALAAFQKLGVPGPKHEEYKYTPLGKALEKTFDFSIPTSVGTIAEINYSDFFIPDLDAYNLVFLNGRFVAAASNIPAGDNKVTVEEFSKAYKNDPGIIDNHFAKYADYQADPFVALNTAFSEHGIFIKIGDHAVVDKPIILHWINQSNQGQVFHYPRNLMLVGENSEATVVEKFDTLGTVENFTNTVSEIVLAPNARFNYYKVQPDGEGIYHLGNTQIYQARSSFLNAVNITLGGTLIRNNLNISLDGEGCESHMYGLYLLNGRSHVDNHTAVDHKKPNSYSNELYKGILDENSTGVFNGKIYVRQDAQKTNAFQSNSNILLSDTATVHTKPQLEIWADDVKCSHGCTTGQLDKDALFYLQTRGLDKDKAKALLLYAFAIDAIENVKSEALQGYLNKIITERLYKDF